MAFGGGVLDVVFEHVGEDGAPTRRADGATVVRAWRDGLDLVPLDGGGWAPLPAEWLARHGHRVADLLSARDAEKKLARSALPELGALCDELDAPRPMELGPLMPLLEGFEGIPPAALPGDLQATLRAYQQHGVDWLAFLRDAELGAVLADDMGLGKTLQTIACSTAARSSSAPRASSTTGPRRSPASARSFASRPTTGPRARSIRSRTSP